MHFPYHVEGRSYQLVALLVRVHSSMGVDILQCCMHHSLGSPTTHSHLVGHT